MSSNLDRLLDQLQAAGIKSGAAELSEAADAAAAYFGDDEVRDPLADQILLGIGKVKAASPRLVETGADELRELLGSAFESLDAGFPEGIRELAYQERRKLFRLVTVEETKAARLRAERLDFLADLLAELGTIAIKVLPLLIAAL